MKYPLDLRFKTVAIARQISVHEADGSLMWYVKMKAFKLKEAVTVYADTQQTRPLFEMQADRMIDVGANYEIRDAATRQVIGTLSNQGVKSLWRAHYEIKRGGNVMYRIREENPWVKVVDGLLREIPVVALFSGYILHPKYIIEGDGGREVLRIRKEAAFFEGRFSVEKLTIDSRDDDQLLALSTLMLVLLEKHRG